MNLEEWKALLRFEPGEDASPMAREERERVAAAPAVLDEATLGPMTEPHSYDDQP